MAFCSPPSWKARDDVDFTPLSPSTPEKSTIVIDPGHGGSLPGARYEGIAERISTWRCPKNWRLS